MNEYDKLLMKWAKTNAKTIRHHFQTKINPTVDWSKTDIVEDVISFYGLPSESNPEPYFEALQHVLNDQEKEFGIPIPNEIIAYELSKWANNKIPVNHILVQEHKRWWKTILDDEYGTANHEDITHLMKLLHSVAKDETLENLGSIEDVESFYSGPEHNGHLYTVDTDNGPIYLSIEDDNFAAMNNDGKVLVFDYDGNKLHTDTNLDRIKTYIIGGLKFSKPITDQGELASLIGNDAASMLIGSDGLSAFDLP